MVLVTLLLLFSNKEEVSCTEGDYVELGDFVVSEGVMEGGNLTAILDEEDDANGIDPENPASSDLSGSNLDSGEGVDAPQSKVKVENDNGDIVISPVIPGKSFKANFFLNIRSGFCMKSLKLGQYLDG
jgi:hypothetical protein